MNPSGVLRIAVAAGIALLALAPGARGDPAERSRRSHAKAPPLAETLERHAERLGLDAPTRARIRDVALAARAEAEPLREEIRRLHDAMRRELSAAEPDEERLMELAERYGKAKTGLRKQRLRTLLRIRALLTPAQRAELVRIHEESHGPQHGERHRERRGEGDSGSAP